MTFRLTIFTWPASRPTRYTAASQTAGAASSLGLLRIHTDQGLEGHAFLGTATNPAAMDGPQLIRSLKPMLMGQDPLARERLHQAMRLQSRNVSYRTIGAVDVALWDLAGKIAGLPVHALMGTFRTRSPPTPVPRSCPTSPPTSIRRRRSRPKAGAPTRSTRPATRQPISRCAPRCAARSATTTA